MPRVSLLLPLARAVCSSASHILFLDVVLLVCRVSTLSSYAIHYVRGVARLTDSSSCWTHFAFFSDPAVAEDTGPRRVGGPRYTLYTSNATQAASTCARLSDSFGEQEDVQFVQICNTLPSHCSWLSNRHGQEPFFSAPWLEQ